MNATSWSKYSQKYNGPSNVALTLPMVKLSFEAFFFPKLDKIIAEKKEPVKVLALACGTGAEIEVLCNRYNKSQLSILATDYAEGMVQMTQSCVDRLGKQDMVKARVMDAMNIDLESSSLDVVFLIMGPMLMPDPRAVFKEIQRILVPGGMSGYLTPGKMQIHDTMSQARKEILQACKRENEFKHFYDSEMMKNWGTPEALKAKLADANFKAVEAISVTSSLDLQRGTELDETLAFMFSNPGMAQMYEGGLTTQQSDQFREKVRTSLHDKWPASEDKSLLASLYMIANAACGSK